MSLSTGGKSHFTIHVDRKPDDSGAAPYIAPRASPLKSPLRCLSVAQLQNRERGKLSRLCHTTCSNSGSETPGIGGETISTPQLPASKGFWHETGQQRRRVSTRTSNALETVPEDTSSSFGGAILSHDPPYRYLELSGELEASFGACIGDYVRGDSSNAKSACQFPGHPILTAAKDIPSAETQHQKHRDGDFEWILLIDHAGVPESQLGANSAGKLRLGCNLFPQIPEVSAARLQARKVLLLVTPLEEGGDNPDMANTAFAQIGQIMAVPESKSKRPAASLVRPNKGLDLPRFVITISDPADSEAADSQIEVAEDGSVTRIEDSFEALDKLEDQLEAFDKAAIFKRVTIAEPQPRESPNTSKTTPRKEILRSGSASMRSKPISKVIQPTLRKSLSMAFDTPKATKEERPLMQVLSKASPARPTSAQIPKPMVKSTKPLTIPSFELPGEATSRRLKEQREARVAAQLAEVEAARLSAQAKTLRRSKSERIISLPTFELPGEAISRRKRDERARQLKAQENEERERREFKAKPIGLSTGPATVSRGTASGRFRPLNKAASSENVTLRQVMHTDGKCSSVGAGLAQRGPLEASNNQGMSRGRPLSGGTRQTVRAVSHASSTGSTEHSSTISAEDIQQQRRKGEGVFRRDNSYAKDREVEKREREDLARAARAEAAERSRLQSREWALKQARKRMTIGSLRELQAGG